MPPRHGVQNEEDVKCEKVLDTHRRALGLCLYFSKLVSSIMVMKVM